MLIVLALLLFASGALAECQNCQQLPPPACDVKGACCYGSEFVKISCPDECAVLGFVWAGPFSDAARCKHLTPCCFTNNGTCANLGCFDCVKGGGAPIEKCEHCSQLTTATTSTSTKTKPTHTKTTTGSTTPMPTPPAGGCCCFADGSTPSIKTAEECHTAGGIYRGDGSTCSADSCKVKCCNVAKNICKHANTRAECEDEFNAGGFQGIGECTAELCGGACCVHGRALLAHSDAECTTRGGDWLGFQTLLIDELCPRACCVGDSCEMATAADCRDANGIPWAAGDTCSTVKCSGACCSSTSGSLGDGPTPEDDDDPEVACSIVLNDIVTSGRERCEAIAGSVYQGDGSVCGADLDGDGHIGAADDDDHQDDELEALEIKGQCFNDGACCLRDKNAGDENGCVRTPDVQSCVARNGTFQGIGSRCDQRNMCKLSACCLGTQGGCVDVHIGTGAVECRLKGGRYVGDGTTCELPGMCDPDSGACCCEGQCLNMPNATACYEFGGCSFRGTGTSCIHADVCESNQPDEGACCIQNSYLGEPSQCVMMPSAAACVFRGGVFRGSKSNCDAPDATCGPQTGVCCVDGVAYDDQTADECTRCGGKFAGIGSASGDEGVCDERHRGACCKKHHGCDDTTYAQCKRNGGNFQGFETKCCDDGVCDACYPCSLDKSTSACESDADCTDPAVCVLQFGVCMVPASRIHQKRIWNPSVHARAMKMGFVPPVKAMPHLAFALHDGDADDEVADDSDAPDGPFSCGDESTIGQSCIIHPCRGKCAVGTCAAPPPGTTTGACKAVCVQLHEYDCGCTCRDPWWETCAFISGAVVVDTNANDALDFPDGADTLFETAAFTVSLYSSPIEADSDTLLSTKSSATGRFAFSGLPGGRYKVKLDVPDGYRIEDGLTATRIVEVTCIPEAEQAAAAAATEKRSMLAAIHSQFLTMLNGKSLANHIVDNVYFLIAVGQEPPAQQTTEPLASGSVSGAVLAVVLISVVLLCAAALVFGWLQSLRLLRKPTVSTVAARTVIGNAMPPIRR